MNDRILAIAAGGATLTRLADLSDIDLAVLEAIETLLPSDRHVEWVLGDLVEAAVLAGDLALAESVLAERLEAAAVRQPLPWTAAMAHRGRGLLATARGDLSGALDHFDRAKAVYDTSLARPFERGRTLYARARPIAGRAIAGPPVPISTMHRGSSPSLVPGPGGRWRRSKSAASAAVPRIGSALTASERRVAQRVAAGRAKRRSPPNS